MTGRVRLRMVFSSPVRAHRFLEDVAAQLADVEGVTVQDGDYPGRMPWLWIPTVNGHIGLGDGAEFGERGVFMQAYEFADPDENEVVFVGDLTRVCEGGEVAETVAMARSYLAGPSVAGRHELRDLWRQLDAALQVEQRQLQPKPQQPRLVSRYGSRVLPRQVGAAVLRVRGRLDVSRPDPLAQRVVAAVTENRHGVQRRRPMHERVPEPVRDDADLPALTLAGRFAHVV